MSSFVRCPIPKQISLLSAIRLSSRILNLLSLVSRATFDNVYKVIEMLYLLWIVAQRVEDVLGGQDSSSSCDDRGKQNRFEHEPDGSAKASRKAGENSNTERGMRFLSFGRVVPSCGQRH